MCLDRCSFYIAQQLDRCNGMSESLVDAKSLHVSHSTRLYSGHPTTSLYTSPLLNLSLEKFLNLLLSNPLDTK